MISEIYLPCEHWQIQYGIYTWNIFHTPVLIVKKIIQLSFLLGIDARHFITNVTCVTNNE